MTTQDNDQKIKYPQYIRFRLVQVPIKKILRKQLDLFSEWSNHQQQQQTKLIFKFWLLTFLQQTCFSPKIHLIQSFISPKIFIFKISAILFSTCIWVYGHKKKNTTISWFCTQFYLFRVHAFCKSLSDSHTHTHTHLIENSDHIDIKDTWKKNLTKKNITIVCNV